MSTPRIRFARFGFVLGSLIVSLSLTSCSSTDDRPYGYSNRPVDVIAHDTYIYYPAYEVYYSPARRQFVYFDGRLWVARREPPRAWARELRRAPYVQLDFADFPQRHHPNVVRRYPRTWRPGHDRFDGQRQPRDRWERNDRQR